MPTKKITFVSPIGVAKYPHLVEPDTTGKFATGKFTTKLILTPEAAAPLIALLDKAKADHPEGDECKLPYKSETIKDGETKRKTGNIQFSMSSKFAPAVIDPHNKAVKVGKLNEDFSIGSGSKIRVAGEVYSYDKGLSLQMHQVQIIDLVNTRPSMFDAVEEGTFDQSEFEADEDDTTSAFTESGAEANAAELGL